jgi:hypothetical protein
MFREVNPTAVADRKLVGLASLVGKYASINRASHAVTSCTNSDAEVAELKMSQEGAGGRSRCDHFQTATAALMAG